MRACTVNIGLSLVEITGDLQALREVADLARRAQVGEECANLIGALDETERLDELIDIGSLEHLFYIHGHHQASSMYLAVTLLPRRSLAH